MILDHVADDPRMIVVPAPQFDAEFLGDGDLNVLDVAPIPDGLEYRISKAEDHDILHRLFPEIVIDPVNL